MRDVTPGNASPVQKQTRFLIMATLAIIAFGVLVGLMGVFNGSKARPKQITWQANTYVYDEATLLNDGTKNTLNSQLKALDKAHKGQIIVVSVPNLSGRTLENYSISLARETGIGGNDPDKKGVLLLIAKEENKVRVDVSRHLEGELNDAKAGRILDDYFVPYRQKGDYNKAVLETTDALIKVLNGNEMVSVDSNLTDVVTVKQPARGLSLTMILLVGVVALVVVMTGIFSRKRRASDGLFYNGSYYDSYQDPWHDPFGQSRSDDLFDHSVDLGDSFTGGGFDAGGGDFGGGGASR